MKYEHLLHREFSHGTTDCYALVRDFYADNFGFEFPNYARPDDWWDHGLDLYREHFHECGFRVIDPAPHEWKPADAFLIAIRSPVPNHAAVYLGDNKILHHFIGRRSEVEEFGGAMRNRVCAHLRHKDLEDWEPAKQEIDYTELLRERAAELLPRNL